MLQNSAHPYLCYTSCPKNSANTCTWALWDLCQNIVCFMPWFLDFNLLKGRNQSVSDSCVCCQAFFNVEFYELQIFSSVSITLAPHFPLWQLNMQHMLGILTTPPYCNQAHSHSTAISQDSTEATLNQVIALPARFTSIIL